jgi:serine protease Do
VDISPQKFAVDSCRQVLGPYGVTYSAPTLAHEEVKGIFGLDLAVLTDELRRKYNVIDKVKGVVITGVDPKSPAAEKRLVPGHVIAEVQQVPVANAIEVRERIAKLKMDGKKATVLLIFTPKGDPSFIALRLQ